MEIDDVVDDRARLPSIYLYFSYSPTKDGNIKKCKNVDVSQANDRTHSFKKLDTIEFQNRIRYSNFALSQLESTPFVGQN